MQKQLNTYEVVCEMGLNHHMMRIIQAENEKEARSIMWQKYMDDTQKDNCVDIEVFLTEQ